MTENKEITDRYKLRKALQEIGELKSEIEYLRYEVEQRDKAITAFKKWQSRCAEYKYQYWLQEGLKLLEEQPEEREWKALFALINNWYMFRPRFKSIVRCIKNMETARQTLLAMIEEQEKSINKLKEENNELQSE